MPMNYIDLTPGESKRLIDFLNKHPNRTVRIYSDQVIDSKLKTYKKIVSDFENEADISDNTYE